MNPIWILNENQILYLFSTSAQVLAGVYGLTLTGFIFFRNELSREEFDDDSLTDAVDALKERYFKLLVFITLFSVFTLLISNFVISIESSKGSNMGTIFINVGQASFVINLLVITYFIFDVIAPKRIERASKNLQETFDPVSSKEEKGSLEDFLTNFNQIEYILQKYGQAFQSEMSGFQPKSRRRISNVKLAQIILQAERIDNGLFDEIKRLITLRNSIVHGEEPIVSLKMVSASRTILVELSNALGVHVPEN
jgi:ABC-type multidrug transport system fused ATPase/permease subunit